MRKWLNDFRKRWRESRLDTLIDRRDDATYRLRHWGFSMTPSEYRAQERRVAELTAEVDRAMRAGAGS